MPKGRLRDYLKADEPASEDPRNLAEARRLLNDPDAMDRALKRGLGAKGFSDAEQRDIRRRAGTYDEK